MEMLFEDLPNKDSLRVDEVAQFLRCSEQHVRNLIADGSLAVEETRNKGGKIMGGTVRAVSRMQQPCLPKNSILRSKEAARSLGCSVRHIERLIKAGALAAIDIRSAETARPVYRPLRKSLLSLIEQRTQRIDVGL